MSDLVKLIKEYYDYRDLKWPNFDSAMKFVQTEIAEVYELDLAREGGWVRNNPQNKPTYNKEDMAKELGDCIMMLVVAGIAEGVDPVEALVNKINKKMGKL
jgi:NTP pyrophosphatase (non-canonical NTP hydrolase)